MSADSNDNQPSAPAELDLGDAVKPKAKKAARKTAARKTARKSAAKPEAEAQPAPEAPKARKPAEPAPRSDGAGEFRPSDFKGRGSHFDDSARAQAAPEPKGEDAPARDRSVADQPKDRPPQDNSSKPSHGEADRDRTDRDAQQGGNQSGGNPQRHQGGHQGGGNPHFNKHHQNRNKGNFQGGGKHGKKHKGKKEWKQRDNSGWTQPPPPREGEKFDGNLPAASRFEKLDEVAALRKGLDAAEPFDLADLYELHFDHLYKRSPDLGLEFSDKPGRKQIIDALFAKAREDKRAFKDSGYLDLTDDGYGFVVHSASSYQLKPESVYVPASLVKQYSLKRGHAIEVIAQAPEEGERCPAAVQIVSAMGGDPAEIAKVVQFTDLIPYYPTERIVLETPMPGTSKQDVSMRVFDLLTPIGFGQRGLIVAPPRTGKTVLLQGLANSLQTNYPKSHLIILLIDERPEEVTDFKRKANGEVVSSTFDETPASHIHAAEMVIEKARRMVEHGQHVVILLDSITRLARAYNALSGNSGKIMTGGLEANAMQKPKRFFGSARNIEGGGSLTIIGTALVDTGSKMDEVIFEEFKGTGNMELHLERELINKRIFPAINFERSGTRKEELLYHPQELEKVYGLRRVMQGVPGVESMEMLIKRLKATKNNVEFLMSLK